MILLGEFNGKSKLWPVNDTTTGESTILENITSLYGMKQLISAPTHILQHSSSCIDFIFVNQPSLVIDFGIHLSLHQNCCHQVILCKFNLKTEYHPPYTCEVWVYGKTHTDVFF